MSRCSSPPVTRARWLTISDAARSVSEDVRRIRSHPLVPNVIPIYGDLYDVATGRLVEVDCASAIGHTASKAA